MGELKSGHCPNKKEAFFFYITFFVSANITSARLASSIKCQSSFVRLPVERTNVVSIGTFLQRYGFVMSFSSIFFRDNNGFNDFLTM